MNLNLKCFICDQKQCTDGQHSLIVFVAIFVAPLIAIAAILLKQSSRSTNNS